ncbi:bifunctional folylpolyglutamate synthase/dihydrofolate synthase [Granulicatella seriolae]|uniref:tetrahydrofolate synthase n=1 Tax=Granulicatella seriolae TaxID=2967226 RepID=A0ABT1WPY9_9LACT|nr:folylpolyglutamate synthase/dihydrofolate synthase family protein [Granulicatella seriolae]
MISTQIDEWLQTRQDGKRKHGLQRMELVLQLLDNPHLDYPIIHLTGTNGKGSTTAFLQSLAMSHGIQVGIFVSPHLERINDRIRVNQMDISDGDFDRIAHIIQKAERSLPSDMENLSYFEIMTLIMLRYFSERKVELALIEVGIGGLMDSTNIVPSWISVITSIGLDHQALLGSTIEEIAIQKSGIFKKGTVAVCGPLPDQARLVVERVSQAYQVDLRMVDRDFSIVRDLEHAKYFNFTSKNLPLYKIEKLQSGLIGSHQQVNASLAIEAFLIFMNKIKRQVDLDKIKEAIANTSWPGRMELIQKNKVVYLDGAHNVPAVEALVRVIQDMNDFQANKGTILFGALKRKDYHQMLELLEKKLPHTELVLTTFSGHGSLDKKDIEELLVMHRVSFVDNFQEWINQWLAVPDNSWLVITGSLYFISEIRTFLLK